MDIIRALLISKDGEKSKSCMEQDWPSGLCDRAHYIEGHSHIHTGYSCEKVVAWIWGFTAWGSHW